MKNKRQELIDFLTWADGEVFGIEVPYDEIIDAYFKSINLRPDESGSVSENEDKKNNCNHEGHKRSDPLGGFYCCDCHTFVGGKQL